MTMLEQISKGLKVFNVFPTGWCQATDGEIFAGVVNNGPLTQMTRFQKDYLISLNWRIYDPDNQIWSYFTK